MVKSHALDIFKQKFLFFMNSLLRMDELFEASFTNLSESGKPLSRCGKCRKYMKLIATKPQRLHCAECEETYFLPYIKTGAGSIRIYKELKCPLDDFELIYWHTPAYQKSYPMTCPYCYNNPPFPEIRKGLGGCNICVHPDCPHASQANAVASCTTCTFDRALLVFDPGSGPHWQVACNKCQICIAVPMVPSSVSSAVRATSVLHGRSKSSTSRTKPPEGEQDRAYWMHVLR